jgi:hypothetical protein
MSKGTARMLAILSAPGLVRLGLRGAEEHIETEAEHLRIVPHDLWLGVAQRLQASGASRDPAALYRSAIAALEVALVDDTTPDLREDARAGIRRLGVHPPGKPGEPPGIIRAGNLPAMLSLAGIGTRPKTETSSAIAFARLVECASRGLAPGGSGRSPVLGAWLARAGLVLAVCGCASPVRLPPPKSRGREDSCQASSLSIVSRMMNFCILPVTVMGKSATKRT